MICLETLFLRVSRFFENQLVQQKWHQDLLDKMILEIEGVRLRVVSRSSCERLKELLRFRHFRRDYYDLAHDWDKLEYLQKKLTELFPLINKDLDRFTAFLREL